MNHTVPQEMLRPGTQMEEMLPEPSNHLRALDMKNSKMDPHPLGERLWQNLPLRVGEPGIVEDRHLGPQCWDEDRFV